jgi:hypothetical protein
VKVERGRDNLRRDYRKRNNRGRNNRRRENRGGEILKTGIIEGEIIEEGMIELIEGGIIKGGMTAPCPRNLLHPILLITVTSKRPHPSCTSYREGSVSQQLLLDG